MSNDKCPCCEFRMIGLHLEQSVFMIEKLAGVADVLAAEGFFGGATAAGQPLEDCGRAIARGIDLQLAAVRAVAVAAAHTLYGSLPNHNQNEEEADDDDENDEDD